MFARQSRRSLISRALVAGALLLVTTACSADDGAIRVISPQEAAAALDAEPAPVLIDVRTQGEFNEGHLEGAILVDYNAPGFAEAIAAYPRDGSYVIYCRSGNRSAGARAIMGDLGFTDVSDIKGGIQSWVADGLPLAG